MFVLVCFRVYTIDRERKEKKVLNGYKTWKNCGKNKTKLSKSFVTSRTYIEYGYYIVTRTLGNSEHV